MRVIFRGEGITDPVHIVMELDHVPQIGAYVNLGERTGLSHYVGAVIHDYTPRRWDVKRQAWVPENPRREPWTVFVELRIGRPPCDRPRIMVRPIESIGG